MAQKRERTSRGEGILLLDHPRPKLSLPPITEAGTLKRSDPIMNAQFFRWSALLLLSGAAIAVGCSRNPGATSSSRRASSDPRVFEMRTYTTHPGKLTDLERRFRDHTMRLFERHGMTNVGYWIPQDSTGENTLVYIMAYPSREAATLSWEAFRADPEWIAARDASEANGPIVQRVASVFLDPTDYSPIQ